jgi:hypothetical protein
MNVSPQGLTQLKRSDNLTCVARKQTERSQFPWRQVNNRFAAQEGAIGQKPEGPKGESQFTLFAA